jgi:signal peptidase I
VIEYETGKKLSVEGDRFLLDNSYLTHHILTENYYFAGGDNVSDSNDSRYWGFVPEEFIIGVAKRISYSRDRNTGKFRWNRLYRRIDKDLTD